MYFRGIFLVYLQVKQVHKPLYFILVIKPDCIDCEITKNLVWDKILKKQENKKPEQRLTYEGCFEFCQYLYDEV